MPGRMAGKVGLVTGAASGIGRASALLLAQEDASVIVSDIDLPKAEQVAGEILHHSGHAKAARLDVADEASWAALLDMVLSQYYRLDVLVNNAGLSFARPVAEMTLPEWRRILAVNLDGVFLGTKHAIGAMRSGKGGSIINVASVSGIKAYPAAGAYGASKAAVRLLSRVAAIECADAKTGIRVNVVTPGGVKTPMWETMDFFQELSAKQGGSEQAFAVLAGNAGSQQFFSAEEVARTIVYLASDESSHLNGVEIVMAQGHVA
jgi:NAD(P)-dependent dehydrogenase (short-subunit alcohol dehydrogenase family)